MRTIIECTVAMIIFIALGIGLGLLAEEGMDKLKQEIGVKR